MQRRAIDLLVGDAEGEARVVALQVRAKRTRWAWRPTRYELGATGSRRRRLVREGVTVRVGVVFLGEPAPEPEFSPLPEGWRSLRVGWARPCEPWCRRTCGGVARA